VLVFGQACSGDLADTVFTELVSESDHRDRLTMSYAYDCDQALPPDNLEPVVPQSPPRDAAPKPPSAPTLDQTVSITRLSAQV
jgi:hypothetical protein